MTTSKCSSCTAEIIWGYNLKTGKCIPVDCNAPIVDSSIIYVLRQRQGDGVVEAGRIQPNEVERLRAEGLRVGVNHFQTCPNAKHHRKKENEQQQ